MHLNPPTLLAAAEAEPRQPALAQMREEAAASEEKTAVQVRANEQRASRAWLQSTQVPWGACAHNPIAYSIHCTTQAFLYPDPEELPENFELPIWDHLDELRERVLVAVLACTAAIAACFCFSKVCNKKSNGDGWRGKFGE